ncbi:MAG: integrase arm-type DNA-binding domain-containing protein, partial [Pseudomonadota bacterium]
MRKKLTDRFLESIKPPETGRDTYSDTVRPGLLLRVGQRKSSWVFEKRVKGGPKRKHTLGAWPDMRLAEARAAAAEIEAEAVRGQDRVAMAEAATLEAERKAATTQTVDAVLHKYEGLKLSSLTTGPMVARDLRKVLAPYLNVALTDLTRADLQAPIDELAARGRLVYANRIRAYLRAFTNWCARREYLEANIGATLEGTGREMPRDRVLSLAEVQSVYRATFEIGDLFGPMFRLLILTGQRRGEIATLQ